MDRGYVLHSYPYRETSLILQVWTEKHGRLGLVAKGARRPKSPSRSVLVPFQLLALDWFGRGELRTLKTAEPAVPATPLGGASLLSAFYSNELLLKLTTRDDPHEALFDAYDAAIARLRALSRGERLERRCRSRAAGCRATSSRCCAVSSSRCCRSWATRSSSRARPIRARPSWPSASTSTLPNGVRFPWRAMQGSRRTRCGYEASRCWIFERGHFDDPQTIAQSKQLMRMLINISLNGQELATRTLVRDLQRLDESA